ncbi:hypothetical protein NQ117_05450 [Paenibacillus sp. SC116]|uniref:hypothetical protein n=1 Tax=Paenibacillus sp. SC116 TaxID=2968986 RepID=UPI00215A327B|nr:hypothetical protein [Paenibacillus sp. SC116]MCR8843118.1 hypothetical protein [Paenibacillus sp. SC116]
MLRDKTQETQSAELGERIISDFLAMLDDWHASSEVYDDALDAQIHRWYADIQSDRNRKVWPPRNMPYFSPSSAGSCKRELYEKVRKSTKDKRVQPPHQGRWTRFGTAIGDSIQRDLLFIEKHIASKTQGTEPIFRFERNELGEPMLEDFAKRSHIIEHNGKQFALYGTCDGIMLYRSEDGEILRVGLEVKSKQTTAAQTSSYSMKGPKDDHVKQCIAYSLMYNVDHYVILYVNASKVGWNMTADQYAKNPDIRAFYINVTERDRQALLDGFVDVIQSVEDGNPPPVDPEKWLFNGFKTAIAKSLTESEISVIQKKVTQIQRSNIPEFKKRAYTECYDDIVRIRGESLA